MTPFLAGFALALCALGLTGCKHDRAKSLAASYSSVTKPIPIAIGAIPVEEQYEARYAVEITSANLLEQISALEKELQ